MANAEEVAKAIVAQWGYEEAGWWEPIKQALMAAYESGWIDGFSDSDTGRAYDSPCNRSEMANVGRLPNENA